MQYEKMIATEDTTYMYREWTSYRNQLTTYIRNQIESYYKKEYLFQNRKLQAKDFFLESAITNMKRKPVVAIWGAGNCSDLDLSQLSRFAKLVLIDREEARIKQARNRYGLSPDDCVCTDIGFWDICEEEERYFEDLLAKDADELHLAQFLNNVETSVQKQESDISFMNKKFDFSIAVGLASQLNIRFFGLLSMYNRDIEKMPHVKECLLRMNEQAAIRLKDVINASTIHAVICGNEVKCFDEAQIEEADEYAKEWSDLCEEAITENRERKMADRFEITGSREFVNQIEKYEQDAPVKIVHREGMIWPFSPKRYFLMDVLALEIMHK